MNHKMSDLLNLALSNPKIGMIDCFMLHTLLHAIITRLDIGETIVKIPDKLSRLETQKTKTIDSNSPDLVYRDAKNGHKHLQGKKLKDPVPLASETPPKTHTEIQSHTETEKLPTDTQNVETITTKTETISDSHKINKKETASQTEKEASMPTKIISRPQSLKENGFQNQDKMIEAKSDHNLKQKSTEEPIKLKRAFCEISGSSSEYPLIYDSSDKTEVLIGGIPYVEHKINDILIKLNKLPSVEYIDKLFNLFAKISPSDSDAADENTVNEKTMLLLSNIEELLNRIETMDERMNKIEKIAFVFDTNEITQHLKKLDKKADETMSHLNNMKQITNNIPILSEKQEEIENKLNEALHNIEILEVFMKEVDIMEAEDKGSKNEGKTSRDSSFEFNLQRQVSQGERLLHRIAQLENDLTQMKIYLFERKELTSQASLHAQSISSPKLSTEHQSDAMQNLLETSLKPKSMTTIQNIHNVTDQIEVLDGNLKNLSINVISLETAKEFLEQNIQQIWKEIVHVQEMIVKDIDILNRLTVAEKKINMRVEVLEENINLMNSDSKKMKSALSNIELEKFNKNYSKLNIDQTLVSNDVPRVSSIYPSENNDAIKELEKCIQEQSTHFNNQLHYINQLLTSKYDRWEMEWFQIWLEKSLKSYLNTEKKYQWSETSEALAIKKKLFPEKCLSCDTPVNRKKHCPYAQGTVPQQQKEKQGLVQKYLEKNPAASSSATNIASRHQKKQICGIGKYWGKRNTVLDSKVTHHEIWLEGLDGRVYKGSSDYNITIDDGCTAVNKKSASKSKEKLVMRYVDTPIYDVPKAIKKIEVMCKGSSSNQLDKENVDILLAEKNQTEIHVMRDPENRAHSFTSVTELNEKYFRPGKMSIYAATPQIQNVRKLIEDNFDAIVSDNLQDKAGGN